MELLRGPFFLRTIRRFLRQSAPPIVIQLLPRSCYKDDSLRLFAAASASESTSGTQNLATFDFLATCASLDPFEFATVLDLAMSPSSLLARLSLLFLLARLSLLFLLSRLSVLHRLSTLARRSLSFTISASPKLFAIFDETDFFPCYLKAKFFKDEDTDSSSSSSLKLARLSLFLLLTDHAESKGRLSCSCTSAAVS